MSKLILGYNNDILVINYVAYPLNIPNQSYQYKGSYVLNNLYKEYSCDYKFGIIPETKFSNYNRLNILRLSVYFNKRKISYLVNSSIYSENYYINCWVIFKLFSYF